MTSAPDTTPITSGFWDYLAQPRFSTVRERVELDGLRYLMQLYLLCVAGVIALSLLVGPLVMSGMGGEMPEHLGERLFDLNPGRMVLMAIVIGPLWEEVVYRGWMGLRGVVLMGLPALAAVWAVLAGLTPGVSGGFILPMAAALGFLLFALMGRMRRIDDADRHAATMRLFPWIFWGTAALFMLTHTGNWVGGLSSSWLILAVLPIGLVALVLGYVRMRYGLVASICFHAAYNALMVSVSLLVRGVAEADVTQPALLLTLPI